MDYEKLEQELRSFPKNQQLSNQAKEQFLIRINEESEIQPVQRKKRLFTKNFLSIAGVAAVFLISFLLYSNFNQPSAPTNELTPREEAMEVAKAFKQMQFDVNYEQMMNERNTESDDNFQELYDQTYEQYKGVVTEEGFKELWMTNFIRYGEQLSEMTKANISMQDITFEPGLKDTETELSFDYYVDVGFEGLEKDDTITIFGQMIMIKTEDGWKVDKDILQANDELRALFQNQR